jgi:hypothetical protein
MNRYSAMAWGSISIVALFLSILPGTSDVNVWNAWVGGLNEDGLIAGYNSGVGYIVHPPLGLALLWLSHNVPAAFGVPMHLWPATGFTGFGLCLWVSLLATSMLVYRLSRSVWMAILFQVCFLLNSVVFGYFDLWGVVPLLLAVHAFTRQRTGAGIAWAVLASLVKWQYFIFLPFVLLYALRWFFAPPARGEGREARRWVVFVPVVAVLLISVALFGRGTVLAFNRGLGSAVLSGQALNLGWLLTWAMHIYWPASYGPLEEGVIEVIRTRDTRVVFLVRILFGLAYGTALWRLCRAPQSADNLLRYMWAGYLAFFIFNKGAHENHLVPTMVVAGYLAWRQPAWRWCAIITALAVNMNMLAFYSLYGVQRGPARVLLGVDFTLPLALLYVTVLSIVLAGLFRRDSTFERESSDA